MKSYLLFLLVLALSVTDVTGQLPGYPVRKFGPEHGLQFGFFKVSRDASGFIWLMDNNTIQRFDGKHTNIYFKRERPYSLLSDSGKRIWITSPKGVFRFHHQSNRFLKIESEETDPSPTVIFEPEKGTLACIGKNGICFYNETSEKFILSNAPSHRLRPEARIGFRTFSHFRHTLYYLAGDTIWRHNMKTGKADKTSFPVIYNMLALSEKEIIVSSRENTSTWYYNFSTGQKLHLSVSDTDPFLYVLDAIATGENSCCLATSRGLFAYTPGTDSLTRIHLSFEGERLPVEDYYGLYKGEKGLIWACTRSSLLRFNLFSEEDINFIKNNVTEPIYDVRSFAEDEQGNLWLATHDGLSYWDTDHDHFSTIRAESNATDRLNHPTVNGLVYDGVNLIIGQTYKGIWLYNTKAKTFKRPEFEDSEKGRLVRENIEKAYIHQIITLKSGNHIIVAGVRGAYLMNGDDYTITEIDLPKAEIHVEFAYQDSKENIFIGTEKDGLYCFNASLAYQYQIKNQLEIPNTYCLLEHDEGYYLGTGKGLYFFSTQGDTIAVKKAIPAIKDHLIRILFKDNNNMIWIVSENKLHRYAPETGNLEMHIHSENIRGNFTHANSYIQKSNGQVFIGSNNGVSYFYPEKINLFPKQLYPYIREAAINEFKDSIISNFAETRRLKRNQNTINIRFFTPYYGNPSDISYRYQLTENGQWFNHGNQSNLTLWKLPPGEYNFRIAATLYDGSWHLSRDSFRFSIPPPFWKTWWFTVAMIAMGCGILYRIFTSLQRKLKIEKLLNAFATSLYGHNTVEDILWDTAGNCVEKLEFTDCVIYEINTKKQFLIQKAAAGNKSPYNREIINPMEISLGEGITGTVAKSGKALRIGNTDKDPRYIMDIRKAKSEIAVPIWVDGRVFGIIDSESPKRNFYKRYHLHLLEKIAAICTERITKYLTEEKLRGKIARDLHDEMGSTLTSIHIISKMTEQDLQENSPARKQLTKINSHASGMMEKMSDMVWVVNPANDGLDKLIYRIREYAVEVLEPSGIGLSFKDIENAGHIKLNPEQRKNTHLIAKEALNNAVKYSKASIVGIHFKVENGCLQMHIQDNGKGYDPAVSQSGNGINNMLVRSEEINATLEVETAPGKGVKISISLKIERKQPV